MEQDNPFADASVSESALSSSAMPSDEPLPSWLEEPAPPPPAPTYAPAPPAGYAAPPATNQWAPPSEAAAWGPPPPGGPPPGGPNPYAPAPTNGDAARSPKPEPTKDGLITTMRLLNMGVSVLMSAAACIKLLSLPAFNTGILAIYIWFFAVLLCCFETHLKQVSKIIGNNFGFLYHVKGRCVFFVLCSMLCFSLGLIGLISGVGLLACAGYNAYVIYKHPEYEAEMLHADVEQLGPGSATDLAAAVYAPPGAARAHQQGDWLSGGAALAAQNPELAASAGAAAYSWAQQNPDQAASLASSASNAAYRPPGGI